jgi:amino acid transporter
LEGRGFTWPYRGGVTSFDFGQRQAIAVAVTLGLAWINTRGVGRAGSFQLLVTTSKVMGLLLLIAGILLVDQSPPEPGRMLLAGSDPTALAFGAALLGVMSVYNGWAGTPNAPSRGHS